MISFMGHEGRKKESPSAIVLSSLCVQKKKCHSLKLLTLPALMRPQSLAQQSRDFSDCDLPLPALYLLVPLAAFTWKSLHLEPAFLRIARIQTPKVTPLLCLCCGVLILSLSHGLLSSFQTAFPVNLSCLLFVHHTIYLVVSFPPALLIYKALSVPGPENSV